MARLPKPLVTITGTALTSIAVALVVVGADSAAATAHVSRTLTVAVDGSGSVTSGPAGINCPSQTCQTTFADGTAVSLTATAATGSVFNGWGGDCAGQGATCNVTMQADRSVTANFATRDVVPTIGTAGATTAALPPATKPVEVSVSGDGTVVSTQAAVFPP